MKVCCLAVSMLLAICGLMWVPAVGAAGSQEPRADEPIKTNYKTWSLFLFCNTNAEDDQGRIDEIYRKYERFGVQLGDDHLAVWFCRNPIDDDQGWNCTHKAVDIEASQRFCDVYNLDYVDGPYLVVTPNHPRRGVRRRPGSNTAGPFQRDLLSRLFTRSPVPDNYLVVSLRDKDTKTISDFHDTIVQTLRRPRLGRAESNWEAVLSAFDYIRLEEDEIVREQIKSRIPVLLYENRQSSTFDVALVE